MGVGAAARPRSRLSPASQRVSRRRPLDGLGEVDLALAQLEAVAVQDLQGLVLGGQVGAHGLLLLLVEPAHPIRQTPVAAGLGHVAQPLHLGFAERKAPYRGLRSTSPHCLMNSGPSTTSTPSTEIETQPAPALRVEMMSFSSSNSLLASDISGTDSLGTCRTARRWQPTLPEGPPRRRRSTCEPSPELRVGWVS